MKMKYEIFLLLFSMQSFAIGETMSPPQALNIPVQSTPARTTTPGESVVSDPLCAQGGKTICKPLN